MHIQATLRNGASLLPGYTYMYMYMYNVIDVQCMYMHGMCTSIMFDSMYCTGSDVLISGYTCVSDPTTIH